MRWPYRRRTVALNGRCVSSSAGEPELAQALEALQIILRIRDGGRIAFDDSEDRRLAAAFCWANVDSALK